MGNCSRCTALTWFPLNCMQVPVKFSEPTRAAFGWPPDPLIRNLLRVSVYQLRFLDKIPDYAAVNEAVELARNHSGSKSAGFVNAVLRNFLRDKDRIIGVAPKGESVAGLAVTYSHPEWLVKRWIDEFGAEAAKTLMHANNQRATVVLRVNCL